ncbi:MAG: flavin reductase family protein [Bacteroidales bacterium]|nr:flavin reductase family protein [Bacteroidales bacterium]
MKKNTFVSIDPKELNDSAIRLIGYDWMLITAGSLENYNTMTAAWGQIGFLWKKPVVTTYIRPVRHTYKFAEEFETFSLCFFEEDMKPVLNLLGTKSGQDINKMQIEGLTAFKGEHSVCFEQAKLIIECRKIYADDIKPELFIDEAIDKNYPKKDYHRFYIGEILSCRIKA